MKDNPYSQDKEEIRELLKQFQHLKAGRSHSFLDEDAFEKIIDHFDDAEDLVQANFTLKLNHMLKKSLVIGIATCKEGRFTHRYPPLPGSP